MTLEQIRETLPAYAGDIKLNLQSVMTSTALTPAQSWGVAVATAAAARNPRLRDAVIGEARAQVEHFRIERFQGIILFSARTLVALSKRVVKRIFGRFDNRFRSSRRGALIRHQNDIGQDGWSGGDLNCFPANGSELRSCV